MREREIKREREQEKSTLSLSTSVCPAPETCSREGNLSLSREHWPCIARSSLWSRTEASFWCRRIRVREKGNGREKRVAMIERFQQRSNSIQGGSHRRRAQQ